MSNLNQEAARILLETIPSLMRKMHTNIRGCELNLAPSHYHMLIKLQHGPMKLTELAENQEVSLATISKTASTLAERGWIKRLPSTHDRRVIRVEITQTGRAILRNAYQQLLMAMTMMMSDIRDDDLNTLISGLSVLQQILEPFSVLDDTTQDNPHLFIANESGNDAGMDIKE